MCDVQPGLLSSVVRLLSSGKAVSSLVGVCLSPRGGPLGFGTLGSSPLFMALLLSSCEDLH